MDYSSYLPWHSRFLRWLGWFPNGMIFQDTVFGDFSKIRCLVMWKILLKDMISRDSAFGKSKFDDLKQRRCTLLNVCSMHGAANQKYTIGYHQKSYASSLNFDLFHAVSPFAKFLIISTKAAAWWNSDRIKCCLVVALPQHPTKVMY